MSVSGLASWENNIQYKQVILSDNTSDQTPVTVGSIRVNNKILEISRVTNSDPSTIGYMLPYIMEILVLLMLIQMVLEDQSHQIWNNNYATLICLV
jgi:hypothetical protein